MNKVFYTGPAQDVKMVRPSITKLSQHGSAGWQWEVDGKPMRTDRMGNGLWHVGSYAGRHAANYQDKQVQGTSQFSLPLNKAAARAQLYREFAYEVF